MSISIIPSFIEIKVMDEICQHSLLLTNVVIFIKKIIDYICGICGRVFYFP